MDSKRDGVTCWNWGTQCSIKTTINYQLLRDEIQHHLDESVVQKHSVCCQGQNLRRLRSGITPLALDENTQHYH
eukprot:10967091-Ditylum_brightwellii.AAC.1